MISPDRVTRTQNSFVAASSVIGPSITAGGTANTKGAYGQLIAAAGFDASFIYLEWNSTFTANTDTSSLMDIAIDPAGGTSYTVIVSNMLCGSVGGPVQVGTRSMLIPVSIPRGSSIAARYQSVSAGHTMQIGCRLYGGVHPNQPRLHRGPLITYGVTEATSSAINVVNAGSPNTKGAWAAIGTASRQHSGVVVGLQLGTGTTGNERPFYDIGMDPAGGTAYTTIIPEIAAASSTAEEMVSADPVSAILHVSIPSGATFAARGQSAGGGGQDIFDIAVYGF